MGLFLYHIVRMEFRQIKIRVSSNPKSEMLAITRHLCYYQSVGIDIERKSNVGDTAELEDSSQSCQALGLFLGVKESQATLCSDCKVVT